MGNLTGTTKESKAARQHYKTLGINSDATQEEIKKAYRQKAIETHPDKNNGEDAGFVAVNKANEILSDPEKRKKYDETGFDGGNDEAQKVTAFITSMTMMYLENVKNVKKQSLTEFMKVAIRDNRHQAEGIITNLKTTLERYKIASERIKKVSEGENVIKGVMLANIERTEMEILHHETNLALFKKALEEVEGYSYLVDADEHHNNSKYRPVNWGATTV